MLQMLWSVLLLCYSQCQGQAVQGALAVNASVLAIFRAHVLLTSANKTISDQEERQRTIKYLHGNLVHGAGK